MAKLSQAITGLLAAALGPIKLVHRVAERVSLPIGAARD
jgi:hypothetical protein